MFKFIFKLKLWQKKLSFITNLKNNNEVILVCHQLEITKNIIKILLSSTLN